MPDTYVALLRGINVGRANRVAMADLRSLVADLGYASIRTLLNSGNVVFQAPATGTEELAAQIEGALSSRLNLSVQVVVLTGAELAVVVNGNPLLEVSNNPSRLMVSFFREPVDQPALESLLGRDWSPEALALGQGAVYLWCPGGLIESPLAKAVARALGNIVTTARNWATVTKLHEIVKAE